MSCNSSKRLGRCPVCGNTTQAEKSTLNGFKYLCTFCSSGPKCYSISKVDAEDTWKEWAEQYTQRRNINVMSVLPSDTVVLKKKIFEYKYLPEFCGMTIEEFDAMPDSTLKTSIRTVFFDGVYKNLHMDHLIDVVGVFSDLLSCIPDTHIMESGDGKVFFRTDERSLPLAFSNALLTRLNYEHLDDVKVIITSNEPRLIRVTSTGKNLFEFETRSYAWDFLKDVQFDPDEVVPKAFLGLSKT